MRKSGKSGLVIMAVGGACLGSARVALLPPYLDSIGAKASGR